MSCILVTINLQLLQDKLMNKHLTFQIIKNLNTLSLCLSSGKCIFWPWLSAPMVVQIAQNGTHNEEDMVVKNKQG
jgi:hypothetical protein